MFGGFGDLLVGAFIGGVFFNIDPRAPQPLKDWVRSWFEGEPKATKATK